jgi:hypothetical protein
MRAVGESGLCGYSNDLIKVNHFAHHIVFRGCVFYKQNDHGGDEHLDINTVTDVRVEDSIFFNDYAGIRGRLTQTSRG